MILDDKRLKFICLCAFMNREIEILEEREKNNEGENCIDDNDGFVRDTLKKIQNRMNEKFYNKKALILLRPRFPKVEFYYNLIESIISRHVKKDEKWIPSIVILSSIQEYSLRGYTLFDDIDFNSCIDRFINDKRAEHKFNMEIALDIVETLAGVKVPKKFQYKKKNNRRVS